MGGERTGMRKHVLLYATLLTCLLVFRCAAPERPAILNDVPPPEDWTKMHLVHGKKLLAQRNYDGALQEWQIVLSMSDGKPPADESLFYMGQTYCDPVNPKKDFAKSIASFQRLAKEYPQSPWADTARIWMGHLLEQERLKRVMFESLQENERLKKQWNDAVQENERLKRLSNETLQENAKLKKIVEQSKTVDAEIDEKKKSQAK
jgi:tetratricopeptide (TPR) repeat protein